METSWSQDCDRSRWSRHDMETSKCRTWQSWKQTSSRPSAYSSFSWSTLGTESVLLGFHRAKGCDPFWCSRRPYNQVVRRMLWWRIRGCRQSRELIGQVVHQARSKYRNEVLDQAWSKKITSQMLQINRKCIVLEKLKTKLQNYNYLTMKNSLVKIGKSSKKVSKIWIFYGKKVKKIGLVMKTMW